MIRRNLAAKIGLSIMGLVLVVSVVQYFVLGRLLRNAFYQQFGAELVSQGQQYANMSAMGGTMMMQMLCNTADTSLVMTNKHGNIIAASPSLHLSQPNASDDSAIQQALAGRDSLHGGYSAMFGNTGMVVAVPIRTAGQTAGAVILFRAEGLVEAAFHHVEWLLALAGAGGIVVALGFTVILSKRIANPLRQMAAVAKGMGCGNYDAKVHIFGDDEVAQLGAAINELAANLDRLESSRREFLADVSHELRTPMSYIRGYSEVLHEGLVQSPDETKNYLGIINDESRRLEGLVNDLFALAQADAGILPVEKRPIHLEDVIHSVVERMRKRAEDRQIFIRTALSPLRPVEADPTRLEQVLVNLVENAIRYTPPNGSIEVSAKPVDNWIEVIVSDSGIGIPKSDLPYIWDRLYRVEKSRSRTGGGSGLGLAIVKHIVESHGGSVHADSVETAGTTISFRIPLPATMDQHP